MPGNPFSKKNKDIYFLHLAVWLVTVIAVYNLIFIANAPGWLAAFIAGVGSQLLLLIFSAYRNKKLNRYWLIYDMVIVLLILLMYWSDNLGIGIDPIILIAVSILAFFFTITFILKGLLAKTK